MKRQARRRRRTPTILQVEAVECGAAALAMILAHHGRWESLIDLRRICGVSRDGSRASNLVRAAEHLGFVAKGFRYEPKEIIGLPMPAIVFVNGNHFMVLEAIGQGKVRLNDPAIGRLSLSRAEFDLIFSGVILTFEPTADFKRGGQKPSVLRPLLTRLSGAWTSVILAVLVGVVLVVPTIVMPVFLRVFLDEVVIGVQTDWMPWLLGAMAATIGVQACLALSQGRVQLGLRNRIALGAAAGFTWQVLRLPVTFFSQRSPGSISSRIDMSDQLAGNVLQLPGLVVAVVSMLVVGGIMVLYSPILTLVSLVVAVAATLMFVFMRDQLTGLERAGSAGAVKLSGRTMQGLGMIEVLKASGTEDAFFESWAGQHALVVTQRQRTGRLESVFAATPEFLTQLGLMALLILAGLLIMEGRLTLGMLIAFMALQASFYLPMRAFLAQLIQISKARATLDQFDDVMGHPIATEFAAAVDVPLPMRPHALGRVQKLQGRLEVRDLTFGYSVLEPALIEDFSLDLQPGSRVALVGGSGSGKSTVGRLIAGLYVPWSGQILIDGQPLDAIPRPILRNSMAVVDQDIVMFSGTVRENIALWDTTMPEERLVRAARDAMIHSDIARRAGSYDSRVEEGGDNFSGGQRQRLEIARALVIDPSILILDEATSALDPVVEKAVMDNLRRRGCTCIVIAHRLSTIRDCDEIIVMARGRVVQRGTHDAMALTDGPYRTLIET